MKKLTPILLVLCVAGYAVAGINTNKDLGPLNLYIAADGVGTIVDDGARAFTFDGYSIASRGMRIANEAWVTIPENVAVGGLGGGADIGQTMEDALTWTTMADTTYLVSEAHLYSAATLQIGAGIAMGAAFPGGTQADLTFTYVNSATLESYEGQVLPVQSEPLAGDANGDGAVTDADYTIWADNYGASDADASMGDFNGDGEVTDADYTIWADNYGATAGTVPEPITAVLLAAGGLAMARRLRD